MLLEQRLVFYEEASPTNHDCKFYLLRKHEDFPFQLTTSGDIFVKNETDNLMLFIKILDNLHGLDILYFKDKDYISEFAQLHYKKGFHIYQDFILVSVGTFNLEPLTSHYNSDLMLYPKSYIPISDYWPEFILDLGETIEEHWSLPGFCEYHFLNLHDKYISPVSFNYMLETGLGYCLQIERIYKAIEILSESSMVDTMQSLLDLTNGTDIGEYSIVSSVVKNTGNVTTLCSNLQSQLRDVNFCLHLPYKPPGGATILYDNDVSLEFEIKVNSNRQLNAHKLVKELYNYWSSLLSDGSVNEIIYDAGSKHSLLFYISTTPKVIQQDDSSLTLLVNASVYISYS